MSIALGVCRSGGISNVTLKAIFTVDTPFSRKEPKEFVKAKQTNTLTAKDIEYINEPDVNSSVRIIYRLAVRTRSFWGTCSFSLPLETVLPLGLNIFLYTLQIIDEAPIIIYIFKNYLI
ncbi:hypothetical protein [Segetibacter koreensis]|uniref:hypothetical protein n=1 Tax=Segetibacter koreensis TaxID=398037 RepID=UPI00036BA474|nr:hypothetical protein [Segetibacter koreensis]